MMKTTIAIFIALLITACSQSETENNTSSIQKEEKIEKKEQVQEKSPIVEISSKEKDSNKTEVKEPILTIITLDEKEINISEAEGGLMFQEYKDKAIFIVLFGYRCPPCLQEMPNLIAIEKKYPDLEIIAIEVQGLNNQELQAFKKRKGINYTLAVGSQNNEFIKYIASRAQWQGSIPFFLAFNKKGEVKVVHVGALSSKQLEIIYKDINK